jgi:copper chaperone CopZ
VSTTQAQEEVGADRAVPELRRVEATVGRMTCAVQRTLGRQSGVAAAGVNYATGQATVTYDPAVTDIDTLAGVVDHIGYQLTLVRRRSAP